MSSLPKYADVIVDISLEKLDKPFTYRIPDELINELAPGSPVTIPFGNSNKQIKGYIISLKDSAKDCGVAEDKIKDIIAPAKKTIGMEDEFIELAGWISKQYGCTMNLALKTVLPVKKVAGTKSKGPVNENYASYNLHTPTPAQSRVLQEFYSDYEKDIRKTYLLHGVTGSGKTDVYIHMLRHVIDSGRKAILLIPEINLTYQTITRLYSVFGSRIAVIHSKLNPGERFAQINKCKTGEADIIIGPRSAIFAPMKDIGLIVIDEEHDGAYKNDHIPRYNTIDVAKHRAFIHNASLVLVSATPSPASYKNALNGEYALLELKERATGASLPDIEVIDMREELGAGNRSIFSRRLDELIRDRLNKKEQVILFMNRRGYSNFVSCRSCGNAIRCPHCDVTLTVHEGHRLKCHYCGYNIELPKICPVCGSRYIAEFGVGTQKLEHMSRKMYPEARIARLDTDSATAKKAAENILRSMAEGETDILIGTQMVVKGHDFPDVTLVGIMAAETSLYMSNYDSSERTYELITQAAGRAGRDKKKGAVVIQTYKPEHYAIAEAAHGSYETYYDNEIGYRKLLKYPPEVYIWTIQLSDKNEKELIRITDYLKNKLEKICAEADISGDGTQMIGPVNPEIYKIQDFFRKIIYIKQTDYDKLLKIKDKFEEEYKKIRTDSDISIMYDFS